MAEKITINVPHKLGKSEARARIDRGFAKIQQNIVGKNVEVQQVWQDEQMTFQAGALGQKITGTLWVEETKVRIEVDLPWFLAKLSGTVSEKLKKGTTLLLEKK